VRYSVHTEVHTEGRFSNRLDSEDLCRTAIWRSLLLFPPQNNPVSQDYVFSRSNNFLDQSLYYKSGNTENDWPRAMDETVCIYP
jgi:hypothetical protein